MQETLQLLSEAQDEAAMRQALLAVRRASMNCYTFEARYVVRRAMHHLLDTLTQMLCSAKRKSIWTTHPKQPNCMCQDPSIVKQFHWTYVSGVDCHTLTLCAAPR